MNNKWTQRDEESQRKHLEAVSTEMYFYFSNVVCAVEFTDPSIKPLSVTSYQQRLKPGTSEVQIRSVTIWVQSVFLFPFNS